MPHWVPYLGLAIFPVIMTFPFNVVHFLWGYRHGSDPMPPELLRKVSRIERYLSWLRNGLLLTIVFGLTMRYSVSLAQIGLRTDGWQRNALIGIVAGFLRIAFQGFLLALLPARARKDTIDRRLLEESTGYWMFSDLLGVFAEELWIAFSLVALKQTGYSSVLAVILTATVFGAMHYYYRFGAMAQGLFGVLSACLFLCRGSLLPSYLFHYIGNIAGLYWTRRASCRGD